MDNDPVRIQTVSSCCPRFGTIESLLGCEAYFSRALAIERCFSVPQLTKLLIIGIPDFPKEVREYVGGDFKHLSAN